MQKCLESNPKTIKSAEKCIYFTGNSKTSDFKAYGLNRVVTIWKYYSTIFPTLQQYS